MKRLRGDPRCDDGGKDTDENNAGNDIAQIQRHRHGIAAGFAKRRRKDFDHPKGQSDFGERRCRSPRAAQHNAHDLNPEKGGYDCSYHAIALVYAKRYYDIVADSGLKDPALRHAKQRQ
jgi:hypothetical protein